MNENSVESQTAKRLLESFGLTEADLEAIRSFGKSASPKIDNLVSDFYQWLGPRPEFDEFFSDQATLARVQREQKEYWQDFLRANVDGDYIARRRFVGETHARIKLPIETYMTAMNFSCEWFISFLRDQKRPLKQYAKTLSSVVKLINLDKMIVVDTFARLSAETIALQQKSLLELSTPAIRVWDEVLLMPLIGVIDAERAMQITESLLGAIVETESRVAILDVTGVPIIDSHVAQSLMSTMSACNMLGAEVIITGISPDSAQAMTRAGIDLSGIRARGTLQAGVQEALMLTGSQVTSI